MSISERLHIPFGMLDGYRPLEAGEIIERGDVMFSKTHRKLISANKSSVGHPYEPETHDLGRWRKIIPGARASAEVTETDEKEETMTKLFEIKHLCNGIEIKDLSDDQIFELIAAREVEIKRLNAIETKPVRLQDRITTLKADLAALVTHLDSTGATPAAATAPATAG